MLIHVAIANSFASPLLRLAPEPGRAPTRVALAPLFVRVPRDDRVH